MNAVVYFSCTGQSKAAAEYLANRLEYPLYDLCECREREFLDLVLVFPVHCQGIPAPVRGFLESSEIKNLAAAALFGGICHGHVLNEIQKKYDAHFVAAAYLPAGHSYLKDGISADLASLDPLIAEIRQRAVKVVPRSGKNVFSAFFPALRSRIGVKMIRTEACDGCGICEKVCPYGAIRNGITNRRCVRCLKCASNCPAGALDFRLRLPLRLYLKKKRTDVTEIY